MEMPVAPGSTVGGTLIINAIKAEVAQYLTMSQPPPALAATDILGPERATEIFETAYDEHARRLAELYKMP